MPARVNALTSLAWSDYLATALERATAAIARLDARVSATPCTLAWQSRASWTGYARALQLQGTEAEEIDVFSHACAIPIPGRPRLATTTDPFGPLSQWQARFPDNGRRHWRETLGEAVAPDPGYAGPRLARALEALRQIATANPAIDAWLALPLLLHRMEITRSLLPCLVVGEKRMRFERLVDASLLNRLLRALSDTARVGLARLDAIEHDRARAMRAIASAKRPASLTRLAARFQMQPMASPQAVSREFGITIAGAGKLLVRAATAGLAREVRGGHAWKLYIAPDLAVAFGFAAPQRGRPRLGAPPLAELPPLADVLRAFDEEMAAFEQSISFRPKDGV